MKISDCFFSVRAFLCLRKIKLLMRLSTVFVFLALQVSAKNHAQETINLKVVNGTMQEIFKKIEGQTKFRFFYSSDDRMDITFFVINRDDDTNFFRHLLLLLFV